MHVCENRSFSGVFASNPGSVRIVPLFSDDLCKLLSSSGSHLASPLLISIALFFSVFDYLTATISLLHSDAYTPSPRLR